MTGSLVDRAAGSDAHMRAKRHSEEKITYPRRSRMRATVVETKHGQAASSERAAHNPKATKRLAESQSVSRALGRVA